jgi:hypothetical protein
MKRGLILLIPLFVVGGIFFYSSNPDIKTKFDSWIGITQVDSIHNKLELDSTSSKSQQTKTSKKRAKIPKTIKPDRYASLDKYARETPDKYSRDNLVLAEYLGRRAKNDLEKARLIYSWIATHIRYDDDSFNTGNYKNQGADSVFVSRTAVCDGFSSLFKELGLLMDLEVEKISGYSKGYGYQPGDKFSSTDHAWNAVKIDGIWQLIDVTWGSGDGEEIDNRLKTTMNFDPYWFCVQPEAFIFSHLPETEEWQLINQPITLRQFEDLPFLNSSFFQMGFDSKDAFQKAISGVTKEFVETSLINYPVKVIELPIVKKIQRGRDYIFSIQSDYLESVMIYDIGNWIQFKREGNIFKIKHAPIGEKLKILVKVNWYDKEYWTIVVYDIVDEKNLTAHNSMFLQWCRDELV